MTKEALTIYCDCAYYDLVRPEVKSKALAAIRAGGGAVEAVPDLCRMCAEGDPRLKEWAKADSLRIFACYPRAVKWLFAAGGAPLRDKGVEFVNMRTCEPEEVVSSLHAEARGGEAIKEVQLEKSGDWIPWFPVIDYERCQNCKQCYGFCLFGVFQLCEDDRVEVRNPANCKTNCPACAKACPHSAIIFPKYGQGPINGDEPDTPASGEKDRADLADLLGGNVYDTIRKRGKRFSGNASQGPSVMKELREKLDIPADVLASLSPAELSGIKKKAEKKSADAKQNAGESEDDE